MPYSSASSATTIPGETAESRATRQNLKRSVLDFVLDDANQLKKQFGTKDQSKLDEYFTGVREIEDRLARVEKINANPNVGAKMPAGVPKDMGEHVRLMCDMMTLAFQADLTRICTFMIANDGSNRNYKDLGVPEGHHDMSHHGGDPTNLGRSRRSTSSTRIRSPTSWRNWTASASPKAPCSTTP